jgi:hypothetical protein
MIRTLTLVLLSVGLAGFAAAQEKKPKARALPRVAIDDPKKAAEDPDFAVQGEYEGEVTFGGKAVKVGIQLVAQGEGKFLGRSYHGGLPGAGWDGQGPIPGTAARENGVVTLKDSKGDSVGEVKDGTIVLKGMASGTLSRVERKSPTLGARPSAGAVVLFGGPGDESNWTNGKLIKLSDGEFLNYGIKSKQAFGSFTAHLEFRLPWMPNSRGQGRANSGVYVQDRYEIQVLDSFGLKGENNECGGIYTQHKPSVNMGLPPMQGQTYDIDFPAAEFGPDGKKTKNARLTLKHNGVTVHDNVELPKECPGGQKEAATPGPFQFQNHGDPLVYRNVWVVEKK